MKQRRKARVSRVELEPLEARRCLSSVGWDGVGEGNAELTYYLGEAPNYLGDDAFEQAIETALQAWSDVADIDFTETQTPNLRDSLDIEFGSIDSKGGTLAQAYLPDDVNPARLAGDIVFDQAERWELGNLQGGSAFDLTLVAVHEIGHALGLEHADDHSSVMAASVSAHERFQGLDSHDVDEILALYAPRIESALPPVAPPPVALPPLTPTPELESPTVSAGLPRETPEPKAETPDRRESPTSTPTGGRSGWFGWHSWTRDHRFGHGDNRSGSNTYWSIWFTIPSRTPTITVVWSPFSWTSQLF